MANHKGGTGKTTSCLNVAHALREQGRSVLLLDCDSQCNLTQSFTLPTPAGKRLDAAFTAELMVDLVGVEIVGRQPVCAAKEREIHRRH